MLVVVAAAPREKLKLYPDDYYCCRNCKENGTISKIAIFPFVAPAFDLTI
jgi:hypothetical protein